MLDIETMLQWECSIKLWECWDRVNIFACGTDINLGARRQTVVGRQSNSTPTDVYILIPKTCKYATLLG